MTDVCANAHDWVPAVLLAIPAMATATICFMVVWKTVKGQRLFD